MVNLLPLAFYCATTPSTWVPPHSVCEREALRTERCFVEERYFYDEIARIQGKDDLVVKKAGLDKRPAGK